VIIKKIKMVCLVFGVGSGIWYGIIGRERRGLKWMRKRL
jgi:hypothetical protein